MREERFGELRAFVTGGSDREGGGDGPVVILLHGFGAPGDDLVALWRVLEVPCETRFVFPEGPLSLEDGMDIPSSLRRSRAWWMVDVPRFQQVRDGNQLTELVAHIPEGMDESRNQIVELLTHVQDTMKVGFEKIVLGGFSQGAMLACNVALHTDFPLRGLVILSGGWITGGVWGPRVSTRAGMKVFQSHGRQDPILPFALGEMLRDGLIKGGLEVEWVPFNGGHEIPLPVPTRLGSFLCSLGS